MYEIDWIDFGFDGLAGKALITILKNLQNRLGFTKEDWPLLKIVNTGPTPGVAIGLFEAFAYNKYPNWFAELSISVFDVERWEVRQTAEKAQIKNSFEAGLGIFENDDLKNPNNITTEDLGFRVQAIWQYVAIHAPTESVEIGNLKMKFPCLIAPLLDELNLNAVEVDMKRELLRTLRG